MQLVIVILNLTKFLPLSIRIAIGRALGALFSLFPSRAKRITQVQVAKFIDPSTAKAVTRSIFRDFGQTAFESLNLWPILNNSDRYIECHDWPLIENLRTQNRGIIALTAHLSNWDLLASYFCQRGVNITTIARPARNKKLQAFLASLRDTYGVKTIWRTNRSGLRLIVEQIKANEVIAALVDQDTRVGGCFVPFFGHPAYTPRSLVELGKRHDAIFVSAFIVRTGPSRYRIQVREIDSGLPIEQILAVFNQQLENLIRTYPSQWVWFHKRWQTTVDGRLSGDEYLAKLAL